MLGVNKVPRVQGNATHVGQKNGNVVFALQDGASGWWYVGPERYGIFQRTCQPPQELKPISTAPTQTSEEN